MLATAEVAVQVADFLLRNSLPNVVLDPVLVSSSGAALLDSPGIDVIRDSLLPLCKVVTPNFEEAEALAGADWSASPKLSASNRAAALPNLAAKLHSLGCSAVVITGGDSSEVSDYFSAYGDGGRRERLFSGERIDSRATHGTGCAFATALACGLAQGQDLETAVESAKSFVRKAMAAAYPVGKGTGPMNHLFRLG
jgi:hydroxymethylpyrimidine/phosphomethylpyrimidine kinase